MNETENYRRPSREMANNGNILGAPLGGDNSYDSYYAKAAQDRGSVIGENQQIRQSEIEAQMHRLLNTSESLEKCVAVLLGRIEKVTAQDSKTKGDAEKPNPPVPATMLGRDLASINGRIQNAITTMQSAIQRIEL